MDHCGACCLERISPVRRIPCSLCTAVQSCDECRSEEDVSMKVATKKRLSKARLCAAAMSARVHVEKGPPDAMLILKAEIGD